MNKDLMIDYKTIEENIKVMRETRDAIGNTPDYEELNFVEHLSEVAQTLIRAMCDELSNAYTVLDVCSHGIEVLTQSKGISKDEIARKIGFTDYAHIKLCEDSMDKEYHCVVEELFKAYGESL